MPRKSPYYYPKISRFLVSVLYHEARSRHIPMTELAERLLRECLEGSKSWRTAKASLVREEVPSYPAVKPRHAHSAAISSTGISPAKGAKPSWRAAPARASAAPSSATKASKGATLHRLSGNQNSPAFKEFHRACGEPASNKL
jgi:hypothetical protein